MAKGCVSVYLQLCVHMAALSPDRATALLNVGQRAPALRASCFLAQGWSCFFPYVVYTECSIILCRALNCLAEIGVIAPFYS